MVAICGRWSGEGATEGIAYQAAEVQLLRLWEVAVSYHK